MSNNILFVDDEKSILNALKREFSDTDYEIYLASNIREVFDVLSQNKIDLLVSDDKMPEMDGFSLLKKVRELYPNIIRIVLTGTADATQILKYLNSGTAKLILNKPWKQNEVVDAVNEIFSSYEKLHNNQLLEFINTNSELPTIPQTYNKINNMIDDENIDIDEIIDEIGLDQIMASKILKTINSAFYGLKTGSLKTAVTNLGLVNVKNVILTMGLFNVNEKYNFVQVLWNHSSLTNKIVQLFYSNIYNKKIPEQYSSVGLLHDIGKAVLIKMYKEKYKDMLHTKEKNPLTSINELELNTFNITHPEVGAYVLEWWGLPEAAVQAALFHHEPDKSNKAYLEIVLLTHLADYYSWKLLCKNNIPEICNYAFDYLNISNEDCEKLIKGVELCK